MNMSWKGTEEDYIRMDRFKKPVKIFFILALVFLAANLINIFFFTPEELGQGIIQKIFWPEHLDECLSRALRKNVL